MPILIYPRQIVERDFQRFLLAKNAKNLGKFHFLREAQKNTPKLVIFFPESEKIHERSEKYEFWPEKAKIRNHG